jgi:hypothetical protein
MDIQRWLDETVLPEQPPSPAAKKCHDASNLGVDMLNQTPRKKRRRRSSTSDSSLLKAPPQHTRMPPARQATLKESADESVRSDASRSFTVSESSTSSQPYARKPRRKTRLERYEPVSKDGNERGTHTRRHRKGESGRKKRKHKPSKLDKPGTGIVQGFQAKNVSKDRLTVRSTTMHPASESGTDDWCSSSREKDWDCSARAGRRHRSRAVAVSTLCSAPHSEAHV